MNRTQLKKTIAAGALLFSASAVSFSAVSQQVHGSCGARSESMGMMGGGHMGMMGGGHMGMMKAFRRLDLTDEQENKISEIQHRLHKQHWSIMGQMIDVKEELRKAHSEDRPDPKAVGMVYSRMFDLKRQMIEASIEAKNSAMDTLTGEQISQLKKMKHKRRKFMHGQGDMMHGQGGMMQGGGQSN